MADRDECNGGGGGGSDESPAEREAREHVERLVDRHAPEVERSFRELGVEVRSPDGPCRAQAVLFGTFELLTTGLEEVAERIVRSVVLSHKLDDLFDDLPAEVRRLVLELGGTTVRPGGGASAVRRVCMTVLGSVLGRAVAGGVLEVVSAEVRRCAGHARENRDAMLEQTVVMCGGSPLFAPGWTDEERDQLRRWNADTLVALAKARSDPGSDWEEEAIGIVEGAGKTYVGRVLLGLTTKTVLDMFAAVEPAPPNRPLMLMHSLVTTLPLYYHDLDEEALAGKTVTVPELEAAMGGEVAAIHLSAAGVIARADGPRVSGIDRARRAFPRRVLPLFKLPPPACALYRAVCDRCEGK